MPVCFIFSQWVYLCLLEMCLCLPVFPTLDCSQYLYFCSSLTIELFPSPTPCLVSFLPPPNLPDFLVISSSSFSLSLSLSSPSFHSICLCANLFSARPRQIYPTWTWEEHSFEHRKMSIMETTVGVARKKNQRLVKGSTLINSVLDDKDNMTPLFTTK